MRKTTKLYYTYPYAKSVQAKIVKVHPEAIELDQTVAYPVGGGQDADVGFIRHHAFELNIPFYDVKRIYGETIQVEVDHAVNLGGIILHKVDQAHLPDLSRLQVGDEVTVEIDAKKRIKHSASHTAAHLVFVGLDKIRPDLQKSLIGCHIREDQARFDFLTEEVISESDTRAIELHANQMVRDSLPIELYEHPEYPDARYWKCGKSVIPCGGTHLENTQTVGVLQIKRKKIGKNKERIVLLLKETDLSTEKFFECHDV